MLAVGALAHEVSPLRWKGAVPIRRFWLLPSRRVLGKIGLESGCYLVTYALSGVQVQSTGEYELRIHIWRCFADDLISGCDKRS